jgi:hypothetical protein
MIFFENEFVIPMALLEVVGMIASPCTPVVCQLLKQLILKSENL